MEGSRDEDARVAADRTTLRWLVRRGALLFVATLGIVAVPLVILMSVPPGYFAAHAAVHAVWSGIVIAVWAVGAERAVVRRSRLPGEVVGVVLLVAASTYATVALASVRGAGARIQFGVLAFIFAGVAAVNLRTLAKAWRAGWRPTTTAAAPRAESTHEGTGPLKRM